MGWDFYSRLSKEAMIEDICRKSENEAGIWETIAKSLRGNHLWTVRQMTTKVDGQPFHSVRYIVLYLLAKHEGQWGYKDISEDMGPFVYDCPLKFLKMANECFTANEKYAVKWRKAVRDAVMAKKQILHTAFIVL